MKKIIMIVIILISILSRVSADCGSDNECYGSYLNYNEVTQDYFVNYYYNNKFYKIIVPQTRQEFIKLEYLYMKGELSENNKYFKTIRLNIVLVKNGLEPLYF